MLPRRLRLPRAALSNTGKDMRVISPHFSLSYSTGRTGCAVVVSKKVEKTSVGRHRLKRRILSVLGPWCDQTRSLIVYARAGSGNLPFTVLSAELITLLQKLLPEGSVR